MISTTSKRPFSKMYKHKVLNVVRDVKQHEGRLKLVIAHSLGIKSLLDSDRSNLVHDQLNWNALARLGQVGTQSLSWGGVVFFVSGRVLIGRRVGVASVASVASVAGGPGSAATATRAQQKIMFAALPLAYECALRHVRRLHDL